MDQEKRKKYQLLKEKNRAKVKELKWKNNVLFKECIASLDDYSILSREKTDILFKQFKHNFPRTDYGGIDWEKVTEVILIKNIYDIYDENYEYYILWEQQDLPCISCKLPIIINNIDDVLAVSFDTWLLSQNEREVIEFHHEGKIVYGKM